jgi:hypothetical protein
MASGASSNGGARLLSAMISVTHAQQVQNQDQAQGEAEQPQ